MQSCLYEGQVTHCRLEPVTHRFRYRLYMAYLDLGEWRASAEVRRVISDRRFAAASFVPTDHLQGVAESLEEGIRELVARESGVRPAGPIRLLTQLRHFGYYFSPLNLFYCYDLQGERIEAVVGEVTNTPWREQHHYVLSTANGGHDARWLRFRHAKQLHVSPFLDMHYDYHWRLSTPEDKLRVHLENWKQGRRVFAAAMSLSRRPLTRRQLARTVLQYPMMTAEIMAAIYWQALRLWWKKCPVYSHPRKQASTRQMRV